MRHWKFAVAALVVIALVFTMTRSTLFIGDEKGSELPWVVGFGLVAMTRFDSPLGDDCFLAAGTIYYSLWALLAWATAAGRIRPRWLVLSIVAHWISAATVVAIVAMLWSPDLGLDFWVDDFKNGYRVNPPYFFAFWTIWLAFHLGVVACAVRSVMRRRSQAKPI